MPHTLLIISAEMQKAIADVPDDECFLSLRYASLKLHLATDDSFLEIFFNTRRRLELGVDKEDSVGDEAFERLWRCISRYQKHLERGEEQSCQLRRQGCCSR